MKADYIPKTKDPSKTSGLVCIEAARVFAQKAIRKRVTRNIVLLPGSFVNCPSFTYEKADNFYIVEIMVVSASESIKKPGSKDITLLIRIGYDIYYSDGTERLIIADKADFTLKIDTVCLPNSTVKHFPRDNPFVEDNGAEFEGLRIEAGILAEAFGSVVSPHTGALILEVGVFFKIKFIGNVQLTVPSFGFCPLPKECKDFTLPCKNIMKRFEIEL